MTERLSSGFHFQKKRMFMSLLLHFLNQVTLGCLKHEPPPLKVACLLHHSPPLRGAGASQNKRYPSAWTDRSLRNQVLNPKSSGLIFSWFSFEAARKGAERPVSILILGLETVHI